MSVWLKLCTNFQEYLLLIHPDIKWLWLEHGAYRWTSDVDDRLFQNSDLVLGFIAYKRIKFYIRDTYCKMEDWFNLYAYVLPSDVAMLCLNKFLWQSYPGNHCMKRHKNLHKKFLLNNIIFFHFISL